MSQRHTISTTVIVFQVLNTSLTFSELIKRLRLLLIKLDLACSIQLILGIFVILIYHLNKDFFSIQ